MKKANKMTSNKTVNGTVEVSDVLVSGVRSLLNRRSTPWVGTMTDLETALTRVLRANAEVLPGSPSALRVALDRVVYRLRGSGVSVRFSRSTDRTRTRLVRLAQ
jgi:molybdopterin biosynthesis enzyme MoaB